MDMKHKMIKQKLPKKHFIVLLIIGSLLTLSVYNGFRLMQIISEPTGRTVNPVDTPKLKNTTQYPTAQMISSWNLMGQPEPKTILAPKTSLRLKLIGIISSTADAQARAIVEDSSRIQKHYKTGDKIKNNVIVKSIAPDHIVIIHNGRDEIVQLNSLKNNDSIIQKVVSQ